VGVVVSSHIEVGLFSKPNRCRRNIFFKAKCPGGNKRGETPKVDQPLYIVSSLKVARSAKRIDVDFILGYVGFNGQMIEI
jgi:hypothetical protein